jgi:hypothetical protein
MYLVYLNKSYDVWMRDAHQFAINNGYTLNPGSGSGFKEFKEILSEPVFWVYMEKGLLNNVPVIFVKDILTKH